MTSSGRNYTSVDSMIMKLGSKYNLIPPAYWNTNRFTEVNISNEIDLTKYAVPTIIYSEHLSFDNKKKSASNFLMHILHVFVTYLHSVEKIQWKL